MKEHKSTKLDISLKVPGVEAVVKQRMNNIKEDATETQVQECAAIVSDFAPEDNEVAAIVENVQYEHSVSVVPETKQGEVKD